MRQIEFEYVLVSLVNVHVAGFVTMTALSPIITLSYSQAVILFAFLFMTITDTIDHSSDNRFAGMARNRYINVMAALFITLLHMFFQFIYSIL